MATECEAGPASVGAPGFTEGQNWGKGGDWEWGGKSEENGRGAGHHDWEAERSGIGDSECSRGNSGEMGEGPGLKDCNTSWGQG